MRTQSEIVLQHLTCANCAAKIADELQKMEGIEKAEINLATQTLTVSAGDPWDEEAVFKTASEITLRHEPDVVPRKKEGKSTKILYLSGLPAGAKPLEALAPLAGQAAFTLEEGALYIKRQNGSLPLICREAARLLRAAYPGLALSYTAPPQKNKTFGEMLPLLLLGASVVLFLTGLFLPDGLPKIIVFLLSLVAAGYQIIIQAAKNIARGQPFDENFLMTVATIGAFAIAEYAEGALVMLLYRVGEALQDKAAERSRTSIKALLTLRPEAVRLMAESGPEMLPPEEIAKGDIIELRPGEKLALDGTVLRGHTSFDTSAITGEALPREAGPGDAVLGGFVNKNGVVTLRVTREYDESASARILQMVEDAGGKKAKAENFIHKFAKVYTPIVVLAAVLLAVIPPLVTGDAFSLWISRALVFLVISCPCALVISIPLSFFAGLGAASKNGILVKGSNYLEALQQVDTVVFDKTGTLSTGTFLLNQILPAEGYTEGQLLSLALQAESGSNHPLAKALFAHAKEAAIKAPALQAARAELPGKGVMAVGEGKVLLAGTRKLMEEERVSVSAENVSGTAIYLAENGRFAGVITFRDQLKKDSRRAVRDLRELGVQKLYMLTGDHKSAADTMAAELGLTGAAAELLPEDKVTKVDALMLKKTRGSLVFVGDGINDAPVLARADVGVAMGGLGADAAIEAADVVLLTDEPAKLGDAIRISRRTRQIATQNIVFAIGVKVIIMGLGAVGLADMWLAVFADVGVSLLAILNALRALNTKQA